MRRTLFSIVLVLTACTDPGEIRGTISMTDSVGAANGGTGIVEGVISFPNDLGTEERITLTLVAQGYVTARSDEVTSGNTLHFLIQGVTDGIYTVGAAVDRNDDGVLGADDWAGFAGGTVDQPVLRRANARQVNVVNGAGQSDLAIGVIGACLLPLASSCVSDSDCRYQQCDCPADAETGVAAKTVYLLPTCGRASRVCQLENVTACDAVCAPAPAPALAEGPCLRELDLSTALAD